MKTSHSQDSLNESFANYELSKKIAAPVWAAALKFHTGGVIKFWGPMECGKTRAMIAIGFYLIEYEGFRGNRVFSNCWINIPGVHQVENEELRKLLRRAFNTEVGGGRWNKCIFIISEADDVYSHITQADKECYFDLKKVSQAYKRNNYVLYEVHEGLSIPKYLRDKTEVSIRPVTHEKEDRVDLIVADGHFGRNYTVPINGISAINSQYRRFQEIY